jgi:alpha-glucoside transport system substrate-binding protein
MRKPAGVPPVLSMLLAASLVGCGGGSGSHAGPLSGATLEVIAYWSGTEQDDFAKVLDLFERETGATVRYVAGGTDLPTLLRTRIEGGKPPNVAITPLPGVVTKLVADKAAKPLDASVREVVEQNYAQVWRDLGTVEGRLYAVYFKANNKSTFWYNTHRLEDNGLGVPRNWDDMVELCRSLSELGIPPVAIGAADGWVLSDWFENVYLQAEGTEKYTQLSRHEIPWTDPSVRRTFEKLSTIFGSDELIYSGRDGALQTSFEDSVRDVFGPQAKAAMVYEGDFVSGVIRHGTTAKIGEDANVFAFPGGGQGAAPAIVVGGDAAVALREDAATMQLMRFLASPEAAKVWVKLGGFLSPNSNVSAGDYPDAVTQAIVQDLQKASEQGSVRFDMSDLFPAQFGASRETGVWKAMQDFLANPDDIDGVMQRLETEARQAMPR